ncbi:MAG: hypothetical protein Q8O67_17530 [Deltaproteobacteria bacterium]|nr:hypothetical protein [Deltaproteobacteria bacterium]
MKVVVVVVVVVCFALSARAEDELGFNGSLAGRGQLTLPSSSSLSSTRDLPIVHGLAEANVQARGRWFDRRLSLLADASLFAQRGFGFYDDGDFFLDHDIPEDHPRLVVSELSLRAELFEHLDVTVGKTRVVWGSGISSNPTDVLNPPRDPTDPSFQRAGIWQLKVDVPVDNVTWSAFFAPTILHTEAGLPMAAFAWPSYAIAGAARRDSELHWAAGARLYALVADTDLNLWMVWSNLAGDAFEDKTRVMGSVSRLVGDQLEVHGEVMFQTGTTRLYADEGCVDDDGALLGCVIAGRLPIAAARLQDNDVLPRALLGFRWMPAEIELLTEAILTVEYLYAADGYDDDELAALFKLQALARDRIRRGEPAPIPTTTTSSDGLPPRVGVDALRKHTLFVSFTKPRIFEDFTVTAGLVAAPEDLSGLVSLNTVWSAQEWLQLQAFVFVPVPSLLGDDVDAFGGSPFAARAVVEARVFF